MVNLCEYSPFQSRCSCLFINQAVTSRLWLDGCPKAHCEYSPFPAVSYLKPTLVVIVVWWAVQCTAHHTTMTTHFVLRDPSLSFVHILSATPSVWSLLWIFTQSWSMFCQPFLIQPTHCCLPTSPFINMWQPVMLPKDSFWVWVNVLSCLSLSCPFLWISTLFLVLHLPGRAPCTAMCPVLSVALWPYASLDLARILSIVSTLSMAVPVRPTLCVCVWLSMTHCVCKVYTSVCVYECIFLS